MKALVSTLVLLSVLAPSRGQVSDGAILYTGDTQAFLEVCGCAEAQLGGIGRRGGLLERYREMAEPFLLMDAGGFVEGDQEQIQGNENRDQLRVETYAKAMVALGYSAVNLTRADFFFGIDFVRRLGRDLSLPLVSSNLVSPAGLPVVPALVDSVGRRKVVVLGVDQPGTEESVGFADPVTALAPLVEAYKDKADFIVLLSGLDQAANLRLAESFAAIGLIVGRQGAVQLRRGHTLVVGAVPEGKYLGEVRLGTTVDGRVQALEAKRIPVSQDLPEAAAVRRMVDDFYAAVAASADMQGAVRRLFADYPLERDPASNYTGVAECTPCHAQEAADWRGSLHAQAYNTLLQKNRHFFPDCVGCHTTGFGYDSGFAIGGERDHLGGVQCEVCHGPGQAHVRRPQKGNIRRQVGADFCQSCHTAEQNPDFALHPADYFAQIDHREVAVDEQMAVEVVEAAVATGEAVQLDLFVMSLCPYGMEAERALIPLVEALGDKVGLDIHFIADEIDAEAPVVVKRQEGGSERPGCAAASGSGTGPFISLHGQEEIDEGRRQLVLRQDKRALYLSYLVCRSQQGPGGDWRQCAERLEIDADELEQVAQGPTGEELFRENIRLSNALGMDLSPTLLINGEEFTGFLDPMVLARQLCAGPLDDPLCQQLPVCSADEDCVGPSGKVALCRQPDTAEAGCEYLDPVPFELSVVNADECAHCNTGAFLRTTLELFPGARVVTYDTGSLEGRVFVERFGLEAFPAYILNENFRETARFERVRHLVDEKDGHFLIRPRLGEVTYWPGRLPQTGRLEIFLPTGDHWGEDDLLAVWPKEEGLQLYYLPSAPQMERAEAVRRACVVAEQFGRFPDYVVARRQRTWLEAAQIAGVDTIQLQRCAEGSLGAKLMARASEVVQTFELGTDRIAALLNNQTLLRGGSPREFINLWQEGKRP